MQPHAALTTTRLIWAALVMGQLALFAILPMLFSAFDSASEADESDELITLLFTVSAVLTLFAIPAAYFARNQIYKRGWRADAVTPTAYMTANVVFLSLLEGPALFSLVVTMLAGQFGFTLLPFALCIALQIVHYPNGKAMRGDGFAALRDMTRSDDSSS